MKRALTVAVVASCAFAGAVAASAVGPAGATGTATVHCMVGSLRNAVGLVVSPHGDQALVERVSANHAGRVALSVVSLSTGHEALLVNGTAPLVGQPWSPDGRLVAVIKDGTLATVSVATRRARNIYTPSPGTSFAFDGWSPDGKSLLVTQGSTLRLVSSDIGAWKELADGRGGVFSPDGQRIAYYAPDHEVHILGVATGADSTASPYAFAAQSQITWQPNGGTIAFEQADLPGPAQLVTSYGTDDSVRVQNYAAFGTPQWYRGWLVWSLAGVRLGEITVTAVSNGQTRRLHPAPGYNVRAWSVISRADRIVYKVGRGGVLGFRSVGVTGKGDHQLIPCHGGPRPEKIEGTSIGDLINARYGGRDLITCGAGIDTVIADRTDTIARDCEHVWRR